MSEEAEVKQPRVLRLLKCVTHGDRVWKGHVICDACGRVYQTQSDYLPRAARDICLCGKDLMPKDPVGDKLGMVSSVHKAAIPTSEAQPPRDLAGYSDASTARPICYLCYEVIATRHKGRVPNWATRAS